MKINLNWTKTLQSRDKVHIVMVPKLCSQLLCPVKALIQAFAIYNPSANIPLFQMVTNSQWKPLIDFLSSSSNSTCSSQSQNGI